MVVNVLVNDSDPEGDTLTITAVTQGVNGSVVNNGATFTYNHNGSQTTSDFFTYTISDGKGGTDTAIVTMTITVGGDTTPPSITAPADITILATGKLTPVALGTPIVSDNVDPSPTVTNDAPAAFPIGTTIVTWTATDASGNSSQAQQTVTVLGPRDIKQEVSQRLSEHEDESHRFTDAIREIEKSLQPELWIDGIHLDPEHGHQIFSHERHAVKDLLVLLKDDDDDEVTLDGLARARKAIDDLVAVDRLLAATLLNENSGLVAADPNKQDHVDEELAKAAKEMDKGDAAQAAGEPDEAIYHYRKAWEHVNHAVKEST